MAAALSVTAASNFRMADRMARSSALLKPQVRIKSARKLGSGRNSDDGFLTKSHSFIIASSRPPVFHSINKRVRALRQPPHFNRQHPQAHNHVRCGVGRNVRVIEAKMPNAEKRTLPIWAQSVFHPFDVPPPCRHRRVRRPQTAPDG